LLSLKLLGTAAGGGFPQWNCACPLCNRSRQSPSKIPARLHLQAVFSSGGSGQFLINASPDLKFQIESEPALKPSSSRGKRNTPIAGIILTGADLDQVLGLLLLREFQPLRVFSTAAVRRVLEANPFFRMLQRLPGQLTWVEIAGGQPFQVGESILCTPITMKGSLPYYTRNSADESPSLEDGEACLGLLIESEGRRIAYTPSLPDITDDLKSLYESCDTILVDGTFWSDAELSQTQAGTPRARDIGHIPMSGEDGSVAQLKSITRPQKIFIHINNTNPVLDPESLERKTIEDAGWQIAPDGWQWR
jgi:pyrroloquinoline quinone biosynthesis protein B